VDVVYVNSERAVSKGLRYASSPMHPCNYERGWDPCNYERGWASMGSGKLCVTIYADITRHFSLRRRYRQWVRAGPRKELYFNPTEVCSRPPTIREQVWLQPPLITEQVRLRRSVLVRLGRKCPNHGVGSRRSLLQLSLAVACVRGSTTYAPPSTPDAFVPAPWQHAHLL